MLGSPKYRQQLNIKTPPPEDPNIVAMNGLKDKLKNFIVNHEKVVIKMQSEIHRLRKENEMLKQNQK